MVASCCALLWPAAVAAATCTSRCLLLRPPPAPSLPLPPLPCPAAQVGDGASEFFPPPEETARLIAAGYAAPATLLVQFANDSTDETPRVDALLRAAAAQRGRSGAAVTRLRLPGTHVTPCGADADWRLAPGAPFTPADALAIASKAALQADTRRLAARVLHWLDGQATAAARETGARSRPAAA